VPFEPGGRGKNPERRAKKQHRQPVRATLPIVQTILPAIRRKDMGWNGIFVPIVQNAGELVDRLGVDKMVSRS
jgi:hypothetical protein